MKNSGSRSDRQVLEARYNSARGNLLLVLAFTVINIILLITESDVYFLFSAYIPYATVTMGMILCGMFPEDFYTEDLQGMEFFGKSVFTVFLIIALIMTALYLISWIFSKKPRMGWLIFALIIFSIDTLGMFAFNGIASDSIIDIVFHIWVIVSLSLGIAACSKLKKLPIEEAYVPKTETVNEVPNAPINNS